jgi:hypothetical protein
LHQLIHVAAHAEGPRSVVRGTEREDGQRHRAACQRACRSTDGPVAAGNRDKLGGIRANRCEQRLVTADRSDYFMAGPADARFQIVGGMILASGRLVVQQCNSHPISLVIDAARSTRMQKAGRPTCGS